MIQRMLAIWSLVPLPFLNPSWRYRISLFTYWWSLAWRILSINLLACAAAAKSCPTQCNPRAGSPPGYPVPGILQARTLEWVSISFSNAWEWKVKVKSVSCVWLFVTPWTAVYQVLPSMGFSRQEYWSGLPLPSPCWHVRWVQLCGTLNILWHCFSLGLEWKLTFPILWPLLRSACLFGSLQVL